MHTTELNIPGLDLDLPSDDLDIQFEELELEDLPSMEEVLREFPVMLSPPPTAGQTLFSERISIRINRSVLAELKKRAAAVGMRYQTFINLLLTERMTHASGI